MIIPWGEWLPDQSDQSGPGLLTCQNVRPTPDGYTDSDLYTVYTTSTGLDAEATGAIACPYGSGSQDIFVGTAQKIYRVAQGATTFSDVSAVGGYTTGTWDFVQFGNVVIAVGGGTSGSPAPQAWTLNSSSAFAALGGSPPKARCAAVVRDFVVFGYTYDATDGEQPARVRWSGFGDQTAWAINPATQADIQDLQQAGGPIMAMTGGAYGTIFQRNAITRMTYEGPPTVFRFDTVTESLGAMTIKSAVRYQGVDYWYSQDGFKAMGADGGIRSIGKGKIDNAVRRSYYAGTGPTITFMAAVSPAENAIYWFVVDDTNGAGGAYIYFIDYDRWVFYNLTEMSSNDVFCRVPFTADFSANGSGKCCAFVSALNNVDRQVYRQVFGTAPYMKLQGRRAEMFGGNRGVIHKVRVAGNINSAGVDMTLNIVPATGITDGYGTPGSQNTATYSATSGGWLCRAEGRYMSFVFEKTSTNNGNTFLGIEVLEGRKMGPR